MQKKPVHCETQFDYSVERPRVRFAEGGRFVQLSFARSPAAEWNDEQFGQRGGVRGKCKGFSHGSRRRMLNRLNQVSVAASLPQFVTMTLPDDVFCDDVVTFAVRAKSWLESFEKRLARRCPDACGFWRIEWKARKSGKWEGKLFPHFHLLIWGLKERVLRERDYVQCDDGRWVERGEIREAYVDCPDLQTAFDLLSVYSAASDAEQGRVRSVHVNDDGSPGMAFAGSVRFVNRCNALHTSLMVAQARPEHPVAEMARKMSFQDWASYAWYDIVGSHNPEHCRAGVRVEFVRSWGGVMSYAAKYLGKADAENFLSESSYGRNWGVFNRKAVPWAKMVELNLDDELGVVIRRIARKYLERRCGRRRILPYGVTLYCDVQNWRRLWERPPPDPF